MYDVPADGGPPSDQLIATAIDWIDSDRFDLAERQARRGLKRDPENAVLHAVLAHALMGLKRDAEAQQEFEVALAQEPDYVWALVGLGRLLTKTEAYTRAEQLFLEALRLKSSSVYGLLGYAILMVETGYVDKAERLAHEALRREPNNNGAHAVLSTIFLKKGQPSVGAAHGIIGVGLAPDAAVSHRLLGVSLWLAGRPFQAREHLRESLRLKPTDLKVQKLLERVDCSTCWFCMPLYYVSILMNRYPRVTFLFGVCLFLVLTSEEIGLSSTAMPAIYWTIGCALAYGLIAPPLAKVWRRWRPLDQGVHQDRDPLAST